MIGEPVFMGGKSYVRTNEGGTLEKLPSVGYLHQCWIYIRHRFKPWHHDDLVKYCGKHSRNIFGRL